MTILATVDVRILRKLAVVNILMTIQTGREIDLELRVPIHLHVALFAFHCGMFARERIVRLRVGGHTELAVSPTKLVMAVFAIGC